MRETSVELFGKPVKAVFDDGSVKFDNASFSKSVGKERATRLFSYMEEAFSFLGKDGVDDLVSRGKEHLLCNLVLINKNSPEELRQYAEAWVAAYEILVVEE